MASVRYLTDILACIKDGDPCSTRDWDNKVVPRAVRKILKKYDLMGPYHPDIPVNQHLALADRYFEAGLELAELIGVQCTDTETVIRFTRKELLNALQQAPEALVLGSGNICDGLGSSFSALFNCAPNVSFSQNVGLISLTGVKSRFVVVYAGIILTVMAFVPKIAAIFTLIPYPVLGGACIMMFGMIVVSGIQVITSEKLHTRDTVILAVSLGVGMGCYFDSSALAQLPSLVQTLLTGVAGTALIAILLNLLLPKKIHEDAPAAVETARQ